MLLFVVVLVVTNIKSDGKKAKPSTKITRKVVILHHMSKKNEIQIAKKKCQQRKHLTPV